MLNPGDHTFVISLATLERRYILHVPPHYDRQASLPVVIMFHGGGGTARGAMTETGWPEKADQHGFLAVFPEATSPNPAKPARFLSNPQIWNDGSGRGHAGRENVDDTGFTRALIQDLQTRFKIDLRQIFATGFSNGASMSFRVGVELSDQIAAIAPVSGQFWLKSPKLNDAVSMLYLTGVQDPLNPLSGGEVRLPWGTKQINPPVKESVLKWMKLLDCSTEAQVLNYQNGVQEVAYRSCREGSEVVFYTVPDLGHIWPGGKSSLREQIVGQASNKLKATNVIWEFFQQHPHH